MSVYREDTQFQPRSGTTGEHATFVGEQGEFTVDITKNTGVVHDGVTPGGHPLATEQALNAHLAETVTEYIRVERDMTLEGTQTIMLQNNKIPKAIFINASVDGTHKASFSNINGSITSLPDGEYRSIERNVAICEDFNNRTIGTVENIQKGSFDIVWNKINAGATGIAVMFISIIFHGE